MLFDICIVIEMYLLSCIAGIPVCILLRRLSTFDKKYTLLLTPWLGITVIMLFCYYGSLVGYSVSQLDVPLLLFASGFLVVFLSIKKRSRLDIEFAAQTDILLDTAKYELHVIFILSIATCLFCIAGALYNDNQFPILLGNNDFILSNDIVEYMESGSILDLGTTPSSEFVKTWVKGPQTRQAMFVACFFAKALSVNNMTAQYLFTVYMYGLALLAFEFVFEKLNMKRGAILICVTLVLFNTNYQWLIYDGFSAQLCAVGAFVVLFVCFVKLMEEPTATNGIVLGLLVLMQAMMYPDLLPFIIWPMCVSLIYFAVNKQCKASHIMACFVAMVAVGALNPLAYVNAIKMLRFSDTAEVGWDISRSFLPRAIGIGSAHIAGQIDLTAEMRTVRTIIEIAASVALLAICLFVLYRQHSLRKGKLEDDACLKIIILFLEIYVITYIFVILRYSTYKAYKALISMSFIALIAIYYTAYLLWRQSKSFWKRAVIGGGTLLIMCTGLLLPVQVVSIAKANDVGTYCNSTYQRKEHMIIDTVTSCNRNCMYWLNVAPEIWDEHYAITRLEKHGYTWKSLNSNTFWDINLRRSKDIAKEGDIYIGSSVFRDPICYGDEIILENETYRIRRITLETPFCVEQIGLSEICGINRGYSEGGLNRLLDCGRWLTQTESSIRYYAKKDAVQQLTLEFYNPDKDMHSITVQNGNQEETISLAQGEVHKIIVEIHLSAGTDNTIRLLCDKSFALMLTDAYFGGDVSERTRLYTVGESIASSPFIRSVYKYANIDQWLKLLYK